MPGSKLARLLQVVGGAPNESTVGSAVGKPKHVQSNDYTFKHESGHLNDSATGRDPSQAKLPAASRSRKRRQTKAQYTVKLKRRRREAGPAAQIPAKSAAAAVAQSLAEESKQLAAEREKLLGGRYGGGSLTLDGEYPHGVHGGAPCSEILGWDTRPGLVGEHRLGAAVHSGGVCKLSSAYRIRGLARPSRGTHCSVPLPMPPALIGFSIASYMSTRCPLDGEESLQQLQRRPKPRPHGRLPHTEAPIAWRPHKRCQAMLQICI